MSSDKDGLMPEEVPSTIHNEDPDNLSSAIVLRITDDIEDGRTLRNCRFVILVGLVIIAIIFLLLLVSFIIAIIWCPKANLLPIHAPTVSITVLIVLAAIPAFLTVSITRAVFGRKNQTESPFTPIHALIQLFKDMRG